MCAGKCYVLAKHRIFTVSTLAFLSLNFPSFCPSYNGIPRVHSEQNNLHRNFKCDSHVLFVKSRKRSEWENARQINGRKVRLSFIIHLFLHFRMFAKPRLLVTVAQVYLLAFGKFGLPGSKQWAVRFQALQYYLKRGSGRLKICR